MASPSPRDLMVFHKLERDFYMRLVYHMNQDKNKVKWVMALWLWFESIGHHDFIRRVSSCRPHVILGFIKEADACVDHIILNVLRSADGVVETGGDDVTELPLTSSLMTEEMNMRFFDFHQDKALNGTRYYFHNVCNVIFDDALTEPVALPRAQSSHIPDSRRTLSSALRISNSGHVPDSRRTLSSALPINVLSHVPESRRTLPSALSIRDATHLLESLRIRDSGEGSSSRNMSFSNAGIIFPTASHPLPRPLPLPLLPLPPPLRYTLNPRAMPWSPSTSQLSEDERSMFITFSRGYPIARDDIEEFFNMQYGRCVDAVMIEKTMPGMPPMYGRLVFTDPFVIQVILNGERTAKFIIKGRHLWARMYVSKNSGIACMNL